jgi:hypothetical protein
MVFHTHTHTHTHTHAIMHTQGVDGSIMVANLPALRDSYVELKAFVLSSKDGGLYAAQGMGAAGALHAFAQVCCVRICGCEW